MLSVGVLGAAGYTGMELLRLLASHPGMDVVVATGDSRAGRLVSSVAPSLSVAYPSLVLGSLEDADLDGLDAVFLCLPHEVSMDLVPRLLDKVGVVVDLSAAYRFRDPEIYPKWYGFEHTHPELLASARTGIPEIERASLGGAKLIAVPGCYVTAATFAILPLVRAGMVGAEKIIVDAASGTSGAGRTAKDDAIFAEVDGGMSVYGLLGHRHTPEMEERIGARVLFTPHLVPMSRGILATCYAVPAVDGLTTARLLAELARHWGGERFVNVRPDLPSTKATAGSNTVHLSARFDERTGTIIALSAIDNLVKGAAGAALQSANVAFGLGEELGLTVAGLWP